MTTPAARSTSSPSWRAALLLALAISLVTGLAERFWTLGFVELEIGGFQGPVLEGAWSRSTRGNFREEEVPDGINPFYYRQAPVAGALVLPLEAEGRLRLEWRATSNVRSLVDLVLSGRSVGEIEVNRGAWKLHVVELEAPASSASGMRLPFTLTPAPLVRSYEAADPRLLVDRIEISAPSLRFSRLACLQAALAPLAVLLFCRLAGFGAGVGALSTFALAALTVAASRLFPVETALALPRLMGAGLAAAVVSRTLLRALRIEPRSRPALLALTLVGVVAHGSLAFFPNHAPPDLDIHVRRTRDLGLVPLEYQAILRYSSQLPTPSQDLGAATAALGDKTLIPYSPLPYAFYYAADRAGLDLYWAMPVLNAMVAMLVVPFLFLAGQSLLSAEAGWLAALLYCLDLAVWHHFGRSHAPAVFGGALGTAALLWLLSRSDALADRREVALAGALLGLAATGYSSLVVLLGLFGVAALVLLLFDARGLSGPQRQGAAVALVLGGLLAGALFYFHYVPGLIGGARGVEAEPDLFPGRTFFIFHNESRQAMRQWALGLWVPLLAGFLALPFALRKARPSARPFVIAWVVAWAVLMLLKEPFLFPRLLRWAKEDQFVSPVLLLCLSVALASIRDRLLRRALQLVVLGSALALQWRDFAHHANSLKL